MATPLPDYLAAREAHETRWDRLAMGKRNWQIAAAGSIAVSPILAFGIVWLSTRSRFVPYVVEVDNRTASEGGASREASK